MSSSLEDWRPTFVDVIIHIFEELRRNVFGTPSSSVPQFIYDLPVGIILGDAGKGSKVSRDNALLVSLQFAQRKDKDASKHLVGSSHRMIVENDLQKLIFALVAHETGQVCLVLHLKIIIANIEQMLS